MRTTAAAAAKRDEARKALHTEAEQQLAAAAERAAAEKAARAAGAKLARQVRTTLQPFLTSSAWKLNCSNNGVLYRRTRRCRMQSRCGTNSGHHLKSLIALFVVCTLELYDSVALTIAWPA